VAGAQRQLFTEDATKLIYRDTRGTPRLINILCDTALLYGFAVEAYEISEDLVQAVLNDKDRYGVFPWGMSAKPEPELESVGATVGEFYSWSVSTSPRR